MSADPSMQKLELKISHLLRAGVVVSGILLCVGWLWMWFRQGDVLHSFSEYKNPISFYENIQWAILMDDRATLVSLIGLLILVALPVIRVLMTGVLFFYRKEYRLGVMALLVFVALLSSFFLGFSENV